MGTKHTIRKATTSEIIQSSYTAIVKRLEAIEEALRKLGCQV